MEREKALEQRCVERVEALGGLALKLVPLGLMGWPDRTIFLPKGVIFLIEVKRAKRPSKSGARQQTRWAVLLHQLGFRTYRISTDDEFTAALKENGFG